MANNKTEYRDESHINEASDVDQSKVPSTIKKLATWIRQKMYGEDVRESIARGIEKSSEVAQSAVDTANDTASRQDESEKIVQNTSDNVNNVLSNITDNAGDSAAPEVIAARKPANLGPYQSLGERLNNQDSLLEPIANWFNNQSMDLLQNNNDIDGGIQDYFLEEIKRTRGLINPKFFRIIYQTDSHYDVTSQPYYSDGLRHLLNVMSLTNSADVTILGGDNCDSGILDRAYLLKQERDLALTAFTMSSSDTFIIKGNHDTGYHLDDKDYLLKNVIRDSDFAEIYQQNGRFGETRNGKSNYFFKDYEEEQIRVIGLDSYDSPEITDSSGKPLFNRFEQSAYSNKQLDWLANTALDLPNDDYHCIIFAHNPLNGIFGNWSSDAYINSDSLRLILESFINGTSVEISDQSSPLPVDITTKFETSGNLVGFFSGHIHSDKQTTINGVNYVSTTCSLTSGDQDNQAIRLAAYGTADEDAFDIIQIDKNSRRAYLTRFGFGQDRVVEY